VRAAVRAVQRVLARKGVKEADFEPFLQRFMLQAEVLYENWPVGACTSPFNRRRSRVHAQPLAGLKSHGSRFSELAQKGDARFVFRPSPMSADAISTGREWKT